MAARRLIVALVVLLGISTAVAIVAPSAEDDGGSGESSQPEAGAAFEGPGWRSTADEDDGAEVLELRIDASAPAERIEAVAGDRLILTVAGEEATLVTIPGLGRYETLDPAAPVRFDLLLDDPAEYAVRTAAEPEPVAVIRVAPRPASPRAEPQDRSSAQETQRPA